MKATSADDEKVTSEWFLWLPGVASFLGTFPDEHKEMVLKDADAMEQWGITHPCSTNWFLRCYDYPRVVNSS